MLHRACIWDKHAYPESYSYLAQFLALPSMPYGYSQDITVSSGIFEPKNLQAINQEIGENNLVEKKIHFDGKHPLYKNVRFKKINDDVETPTSGWFVSVYDPEKDLENLKRYDEAYKEWQNKRGKRAIVVFFEFIKPSFEKDKINVKKDLSLEPQNWGIVIEF